MQAGKKDAEGWFLRACDEAMHKEAAKIQRVGKNTAER